MSARLVSRVRARASSMRVGNFPISNGEPFGTMKSSAPALARCAVMAGVQMSSHTGTPIWHTAEIDRRRQRTWREDALLVEHTVVGEI